MPPAIAFPLVMKPTSSPRPSNDTLRDFTADRRLLVLSAMALVTGTFGAAAAWALLKLIALFTNLAYFHTFSVAPYHLAQARLGPVSILIPVAGGIIVGLMARFGSDKSRGHGIPETVATLPDDQSRIAPKGAILSLLQDACGRRDGVAVVIVRTRTAEVVLRPTSSVSLARRRLERLSVGGTTPLTHGLMAGYKVVKTELKRDPTIRVGFLALGGWDTHVSEGAAQGQLAGHLGPLAQGLAQFASALGPAWNETVVVVISEFGRTMRENGNTGTDHGHGNVMWVMGGPVRGGKVYGKWPGLAPTQLYQDRDLAVTTDFREPLAIVLQSHLGIAPAHMASIFPAAPAPTAHAAGPIRPLPRPA